MAGGARAHGGAHGDGTLGVHTGWVTWEGTRVGTHRGCSRAGSHGWGCTLPPVRVPLGLSSVQAPLRGCGGPLCPCPSGCPGPAVFPELILFRQGDVCLAPAFPRPLAPGIPDGRWGRSRRRRRRPSVPQPGPRPACPRPGSHPRTSPPSPQDHGPATAPRAQTHPCRWWPPPQGSPRTGATALVLGDAPGAPSPLPTPQAGGSRCPPLPQP